MPTLQVVSGWNAIGQAGIGVWAVNINFEVGGSAPASAIVGGDITYYVRSYSLTRGRSSELDRVAPARLTLVLDNPQSVFTPLSSSVLTGSLVPGVPMQLMWTSGSVVTKKFTGNIVSYTVEPTVFGGRNVVVECVDIMDGFQRLETRSSLYTNITSGCLINRVLDNAGFPAASSGSRSVDTGQDTYDFAYFEQRKIDEVVVDIVKTEYGFAFVRGDGTFVFHDRFYRQVNTSVSATFVDNATNGTFVRSANDLYTEARVTTLPKQIKGETTIWTLQDPITVNANSTASWFGSYIDPTTCQLAIGTAVASPVIGGSAAPYIRMNTNASGTGTDISSYLSASFTAFAESFKIVVSSSGATTGYVSAMGITGCPIVTYENVSRAWIDQAACAAYGLRTLTYDANLITDPEKGQAFAQFLVGRYSSPSNIDRVTLSLVNGTTTDWNYILTQDLDSRVSVTNAQLGLNADQFFIGQLNESYDSDSLLHQTTYTLERFGVSDPLYIINVSIVDGTKGLGY